MRIGNSFLGGHKRKGRFKTQCTECNKEETNEHFFLECPKYKKQRVKLLNSLRKVQKHTRTTDIMKCIMGCYPQIYNSRTKLKTLKHIILKGLKKHTGVY